MWATGARPGRTFLALVALAAACGGAGTSTDLGPADAGLPLDGPSISGPVGELGACEGNEDCRAGLDCVAIGYQAGLRECLRRCTPGGESTCPVDTFCYPPASQLPVALASMAGHCWSSLCGQVMGNGTVDGTCSLGAELGLSLVLPGTCMPTSDQGAPDSSGMLEPIGLCLSGGTVADSGTCSTTSRANLGQDCIAGDACIVAPGAAAGTCAPLCDPTRQTPSSSPCASGRSCVDLSTVHVAQDASGLHDVTATRGACEKTPWCDPLLSTAHCATGSVCELTTPVYPHGVCVMPSTPGTRGVGASCTRDATDLLSDCDAAAGLFCAEDLLGTSRSCSTDTTGVGTVCAPLCDPSAPAPCADATRRCVTAFLAAGDPSGPTPTCDVYSIDWGVCL